MGANAVVTKAKNAAFSTQERLKLRNPADKV
jgi:hypothetical protein